MLQDAKDFLSASAIVEGLVPSVGSDVADATLRSLRLRMRFNRPCIPMIDQNEDCFKLFDGFDLQQVVDLEL